jgi:hypothetical protein
LSILQLFSIGNSPLAKRSAHVLHIVDASK